MRFNWSFYLISAFLISTPATESDTTYRTDPIHRNHEISSSLTTNKLFINVSLSQWEVPAIFGVFAYVVTSAVGALMNGCNRCWPHHQVDGRCAIELHGLAKSFGIIAASVLAWMEMGCKGSANSLLWEVIVSSSRGFSRLAY